MQIRQVSQLASLVPVQIGKHKIACPLVLAPMAGVTDKPFRILARRMGAGLAPSEMLAANPQLWDTPKSRARMDHADEPGPISVQIAGYDPQMMANAARHNIEHGADIIDINMGCPAKKVCKRDAGSALMRDEALVANILRAVVEAAAEYDAPVTLKTRTGWAAEHKNAVTIAKIAEDAGIAAIAVHGRTRDQKYAGVAEYDTIAAVKQAVGIPVFANGDVVCPKSAAHVLSYTKADGLLIGRAAQGRPWIFREIEHYLRTGSALPEPGQAEVGDILLEHLRGLYALYGSHRGIRIARKHIGWYCVQHWGDVPFAAALKQAACKAVSPDEQIAAVADVFFDGALQRAA